MDTKGKKTSAARTIILAVLVVVVIGSFVDRVIWVKQIVGRINLTNVRVDDVNCSPNDWLELAPGKASSQSMRYRCGIVFWPFYHSGETIIASEAIENPTRR